MIILLLMSSQISRQVPCIGSIVGKYGTFCYRIVIKGRSSVGEGSTTIISNNAAELVINYGAINIGNSAAAIIGNSSTIGVGNSAAG
jgi:hypothetical protein